MSDQQGYFISIEGVEGMGKSTAVQFLQKRLAEENIPLTMTREPGGTPIAENIRDVLLKKHDEIMCPDTELLLMFAGRAQNIAHVIRPALQRGQWVISDRFTDASFAYQGGGRGVELTHIRELADWVQGDLNPNLTLLMDAPVEIGLMRLQSRGAKDRIEHEGLEFFQRARERYLIRAKKFPERFRIIDAAQSVEDVQQQIDRVISPLINEFKACHQS